MVGLCDRVPPGPPAPPRRELHRAKPMRGLEVLRPRFHFRAVATTQVALRDHRELREKIYGYREKVMSSKVTGR